MKPSAYIETTVVSYLTAWPSRDIVRLAQQRQTLDWWNTRRQHFDVVCSELVEQEASAGDASAAAERLKIIRDLPLLDITSDAHSLASAIVSALQFPTRAQADALHVAIAAMNGVDYLLTWNCRHLTNAVLRPRIERVCRDHGFVPPVICTPAELMDQAL